MSQYRLADIFLRGKIMKCTLTYLETLTGETQKPESEVMTMAFQIELRQLWREHIFWHTTFAIRFPGIC